jgi:hypothetical protein
VESVVFRELAAIRSVIAGEAQTGSREGVDAFRVALRRLFERFELVAWPGFGSNPNVGTEAVVWQHQTPVVERDGQPLVLLPHVRPEAVDWESDQADFPALKRVALSLRDNFHSFFAA